MLEYNTDVISNHASMLTRSCIRMTEEVWGPGENGERIEYTKRRELLEIAHQIFATLNVSQIREGTYDYAQIAELIGDLSDSAEGLEHPQVEKLVATICSSILHLKILGAEPNN